MGLRNEVRRKGRKGKEKTLDRWLLRIGGMKKEEKAWLNM